MDNTSVAFLNQPPLCIIFNHFILDFLKTDVLTPISPVFSILDQRNQVYLFLLFRFLKVMRKLTKTKKRLLKI